MRWCERTPPASITAASITTVAVAQGSFFIYLIHFLHSRHVFILLALFITLVCFMFYPSHHTTTKTSEPCKPRAKPRVKSPPRVIPQCKPPPQLERRRMNE